MVSGLRPSTPTVTTTVSPSSLIRARSPEAKASDISAGLCVRLRSTTSEAPWPRASRAAPESSWVPSPATLPAVLDEQRDLGDGVLAGADRGDADDLVADGRDQGPVAGQQQPAGEPVVDAGQRRA